MTTPDETNEPASKESPASARAWPSALDCSVFAVVAVLWVSLYAYSLGSRANAYLAGAESAPC